MYRLALSVALVALFATLATAQAPWLTKRGTKVLKAEDATRSSSVIPATGLKKEAVLKLPKPDRRREPRQAELAVTYLTKGLAGPRQDPRYAYVYGRVQNIGTFMAYQGVGYEFRLNGSLLKAGTLPEIVPGQEISVSHNFQGLNAPPGSITLRIFASDNQANNSMTITQ